MGEKRLVRGLCHDTSMSQCHILIPALVLFSFVMPYHVGQFPKHMAGSVQWWFLKV